MNVWSSPHVTKVPHAATHLELTRALVTQVTLEMEQLALVGKNYPLY